MAAFSRTPASLAVRRIILTWQSWAFHVMRNRALLYRFRQLISRQTGLTFPDRGRGDLQDALLARISALGLTNPAEYLLLLESGSDEEWSHLTPLLTQRVNYFMRDDARVKRYRSAALSLLQLLPSDELLEPYSEVTCGEQIARLKRGK